MERKYFERDISWLSFNYRVLMEARNQDRLLFDRIKFLSIYSSNQEEFYRVRISEYRQTILKENTSEEQKQKAIEILETINKEVSRQVKVFDDIFQHEILPDLENNNIHLYRNKELHPEHIDWVKTYFNEEIFPFLQPVLVMKDDICSFLRDSRLYFVIELHKKNADGSCQSQAQYALMKIPFSKVPRFLQLPPIQNHYFLLFVDDAIGMNLSRIFPGFKVGEHYSIRVSRDADFSLEATIDKGHIVEEIRRNVKKRKIGNANRLVYDARMPQSMLQFICETYNIPVQQCIASGRYQTLEDLMKLPNPTGKPLSTPFPTPLRVREFDRSGSLFKVIKKHDILLCPPYHSFDYLVRFFTEAAYDPNVDEIKLTQYRVAENSAIINALIAAARNGKKVTVFVELKARFDEENNIKTSERMKKSGINVVYSLSGLKVHAKVALILRKTEEKNFYKKSYAYLSTGNFNESTARIYSDIGLFTNNLAFIRELAQLFDVLEGKNATPEFQQLLVSQFNMLSELQEKINREIELAKQGKKAHIILKMNGLQEQAMIDALYDASEAGVHIDLIVRGICCLVPNQPYSRNIRVIRIIDTFLEHARIWYFHADGEKELYLSSADWMKRNLSRRIETAFPITDENCKQEILNILNMQLSDNTNACLIDEHLNNVFIHNNDEKPIKAQEEIYKMLKENSSIPELP